MPRSQRREPGVNDGSVDGTVPSGGTVVADHRAAPAVRFRGPGKSAGIGVLDLLGLLLFLALLGWQIYTAVAWMITDDLKGGKNANKEDYGDAAVTMASMLGPMALGWAFVFWAFLWVNLRATFVIVLVLLIVGLPLIGMGFWVFAGSHEWAIVAWSFTGYLVLWTALNCKTIMLAGKLASACSMRLFGYKSLFVFAFVTSLLAWGYGFMCLCFSAGWRQGTTYNYTWGYPVQMVCMAWTFNILVQIMCCTAGRTGACWYWRSEYPTGVPNKPVSNSYRVAWTKCLGTVTWAALLRPVVGLLLCWADSVIIRPLAACFAYGHQSMYGDLQKVTWLSAASASSKTLKQRKNQAAHNALWGKATKAMQVADDILTLMALLGGIAVGGVAGAISQTSLNANWVYYAGIGGFYLGTAIAGIFLGILGGFVSSVWLCFVEDRAALKAMDAPVYSAILEATGLPDDVTDEVTTSVTKSASVSHQLQSYRLKYPEYADTITPTDKWLLQQVKVHQEQAASEIDHANTWLQDIDAKRGACATPSVTPATSPPPL